MKKRHSIPVIAAGFCALFAAPVCAQTAYRLSMEGVFNSIGGAGHPDISVGSTFSFTLDFDDTLVSGAGTSIMRITSLLEAEFSVNGTPHPFFMSSEVQFRADEPPFLIFPGRPGSLVIPSNAPLTTNSIWLNPSPLGGSYPSAVGPTAEVSDVLLYNNLNLATSDLVLSGSNPFNDAVKGSATSFSLTIVPEPGGASLFGLSGLALLNRRRRAGVLSSR